MAALDRPTIASYEEHESVWVETEDREDHTFCGIMFPIKAKNYLPVERIVIHSISVRGRLGNLTVHVSNNDNNNTVDALEIPLIASHWTQIYQGEHKMVRRRGCYSKLELSQPLVLYPGQVRLLYVHSTHNGDEAIVYDNSSSDRNAAGYPPRYEDDLISIHTGKAHLSPVPFGQSPIWGWGNAWRDRREFVGQLSYGVVYKLWNPETHGLFGHKFSDAVQAMLLSQRRFPVGKLPDECLYYIFNLCKWDWFNDNAGLLKVKYRTRKRKAAMALRSSHDHSNSISNKGTAHTAIASEGFHGDDDNGDDEEDDREAWERLAGYRANDRVFHLDHSVVSSDDEQPHATAVPPTVLGTRLRYHVYHLPHHRHFDHSSDDDDDFNDGSDDDDDDDSDSEQ